MSVVAFDEVLDVLHELDDSSPELGCPRGVPVLEKPIPNAPTEWGRRLVVHPCGLDAGHAGDCERRTGRRVKRRTRCGKRLDALWINWPWSGTPCPRCARG